MKILALDTSTEACSAALYHHGEVNAEFALTPREHTRLILPMIDKVLQTAGVTLQQLDALAVGCGPGAFTGIRIGVGVAQGLALAADKPVLLISTLAALAQQAYLQHGATQVLAALDARMQEVYWGQYVLKDGIMALQGQELVCAPQETPVVASTNWFAIGHGWSAYADSLQARFQGKIAGVASDSLPAAEFMLPLALNAWQAGLAVPAEEAQPVYLRNKIALTLHEQRQTKASGV